MRMETSAVLAMLAVPAAVLAQVGGVRHLNPPGMVSNPAFSQAVIVSGPHRTVYVGGQNAVDSTGRIVGVGDVALQAAQALDNLERVLRAAGADLSQVVKWQVFVTDGVPLERGFEVFQQRWGRRGPPPAITLGIVRALAHPGFLVEIDAIAVVPESNGR